MTIRRRGSTWQADVRDHNGKRHRFGFSDSQSAEAWELDARSRVLRKQPVAAPTAAEGGIAPEVSSGYTLQDALDSCSVAYWRGAKAEQTLVRNGEQVCEIIGPGRAVASITVEDIDRLIKRLTADGNANATINRKLAALSKMLHCARDRGHLRAVPKITRKRELESRLRWFDDAEELLILNTLRHIGEDFFVDFVVFLIDTGVRCGEALDLTWRDVALQAENPSVTLWETKNGKSRTVPLTRRVAVMLRRHGQGMNATDPVWGTLTYPSIRHRWDRVRGLLGKLDDDQFVLHACRHTCASRLVQRGVPLTVVKEWLGHSTITVTLRYAHLLPSSLFEAARLLDASDTGAICGADVTKAVTKV